MSDLLTRTLPHIWMIRTVARETGEDPWRLMSLGYVESQYGYAPGYDPKGDPGGWGDNCNAFGYFQIDKRYHSQFIKSYNSKFPIEQCRFACTLLAFNRQELDMHHQPGDALEHAVYAGYNGSIVKVDGSLTAIEAGVAGMNIDEHTTGHDYSKRIWDTAAQLKKERHDMFEMVGGV